VIAITEPEAFAFACGVALLRWLGVRLSQDNPKRRPPCR